MDDEVNPQWRDMLNRAVTEPGIVSAAYSQFWNYSIGNQILAMMQCAARDIKPGPIASFMTWKEKGRHVRKGERAIELCMPVTCKRTETRRDESTGQETETPVSFTRFIYKRNWFALSQTEGAEFTPAPIPGWNRDRALTALGITVGAFECPDGNTQGYAKGRTIAISPVAQHPHRTTFHEFAHVVLGHTAEGALSDSGERTPKDIRELEAEATAMLICSALGLSGAEESRGYIQSWFHGNRVPERSAQRIFHAADQILKAGIEVTPGAAAR